MYDIYSGSTCITPIQTTSCLEANSDYYSNGNIYKYTGITSGATYIYSKYKTLNTQNYTYKCLSGTTNGSAYYYWCTPAYTNDKRSNFVQDKQGNYRICALKNNNGANVYQYVDYSIMPTINYKSALIILNYLCRQQNLALTFKYYNQYYISNGGHKVPKPTSEKYMSFFNNTIYITCI